MCQVDPVIAALDPVTGVANMSLLDDTNLLAPVLSDGGFAESNLKHAINGGLIACVLRHSLNTFRCLCFAPENWYPAQPCIQWHAISAVSSPSPHHTASLSLAFPYFRNTDTCRGGATRAGFMYCNLPGLNAVVGQRVRFHIMSLGTTADIHSFNIFASTLEYQGASKETLPFVAGHMATANTKIEVPGNWLVQCRVADHVTAGMRALYNALPAGVLSFEPAASDCVCILCMHLPCVACWHAPPASAPNTPFVLPPWLCTIIALVHLAAVKGLHWSCQIPFD